MIAVEHGGILNNAWVERRCKYLIKNTLELVPPCPLLNRY